MNTGATAIGVPADKSRMSSRDFASGSKDGLADDSHNSLHDNSESVNSEDTSVEYISSTACKTTTGGSIPKSMASIAPKSNGEMQYEVEDPRSSDTGSEDYKYDFGSEDHSSDTNTEVSSSDASISHALDQARWCSPTNYGSKSELGVDESSSDSEIQEAISDTDFENSSSDAGSEDSSSHESTEGSDSSLHRNGEGVSKGSARGARSDETSIQTSLLPILTSLISPNSHATSIGTTFVLV